MYEGLTKYIESCPYFADGSFHFEFISPTAQSYILTIPMNTPEITTDALGNTVSQLGFYIEAVSFWGDDVRNNIANLDFFQKVKKWFEKQNRNNTFPYLGEGMDVKSVRAVSDGYLEDTSTTGTGNYQMQCRIDFIRLNTNPDKAPFRF